MDDPPRIRILLHDPDPGIVHALRRSLGAGFACVESSDSASAERVLQAEPLDIVLSSDRKLLARAGREKPSCKRVLLSGDLSPIKDPSVSHAVVGKPWDAEELHRILRRLLDRP